MSVFDPMHDFLSNGIVSSLNLLVEKKDKLCSFDKYFKLTTETMKHTIGASHFEKDSKASDNLNYLLYTLPVIIILLEEKEEIISAVNFIANFYETLIPRMKIIQKNTLKFGILRSTLTTL